MELESFGRCGSLHPDEAERVVRWGLGQGPGTGGPAAQQFPERTVALLAAAPSGQGGGDDIAPQKRSWRGVRAELVGHQGQILDALSADAPAPVVGRNGQRGPPELGSSLPVLAFVFGRAPSPVPQSVERALRLEKASGRALEELLILAAGKHVAMLTTGRETFARGSVQNDPAGDVDRLAGHEACLVRTQELDDVGHVLGFAEPAEWRVGDVALAHLFGIDAAEPTFPDDLAVLHRGPHSSWADRVHPDTEA